MIYTTEVPHLNSGIRSAVTLGKFDGFHREMCIRDRCKTGKEVDS